MPDTFLLNRAARSIRSGGVVAYPTEAVFGLGCDPANETAVRRILTIKRRPEKKGLILIAADFEQLKPWLEPLSVSDLQRITLNWPGPVTWLLPAKVEAPRWLRGDHTTLAVRVTAHPIAAELCRAAGSALISTSANISNRPPLRDTITVRKQLGRWLDYIVPGKVGNLARPTEIRDFDSGEIIRSS